MKTLSSGAGETAEKLRVLAALAKALGSIHKTHSSLQTSITPEIWHSFLVSMGTRRICSTQTYTQAKHQDTVKTETNKQTNKTDLAGCGGVDHHPDTWEGEMRQENQEFVVSLPSGARVCLKSKQNTLLRD